MTSTSTPASMLTMICLTISVGALRLLGGTDVSAKQGVDPSSNGVVHAGRHVLDETLVDAHLVAVPGLGTLTARGLAGGDLEGLGGQADGALDAQVLALGALDQLGADLLEGLDLAAGQGDADLVGLLYCWGRTVSSCDDVVMVVVVGRSNAVGLGLGVAFVGRERGGRTGPSKSPFSGFW